MTQRSRLLQRTKRLTGRATAILLALGMSGCAYLSHPRADLDFDGPEPIAPARSLLLLPAQLEQQRLAVRRHLERGRLIERTVLANHTATPGENAIAVETGWRGTGRPTLFPGFFYNPFTTEAIEQRIGADLARFTTPGAPVDRSNRWGPYRYIETAGDDVRCVYAWQLMDAQTWLSGEVETFAVDYRVCDGERSPEDLLKLFDQLDLRPYL